MDSWSSSTAVEQNLVSGPAPEHLDAHALVIGIADYQQVRKLPPAQDASAIAALLANEQQGAYPPQQVTLRQDGEATKATLLADLATLAKETDPESTVFIAFSGHGGRIESGPRAGEYLIPVEADPSTPDTLAETSISGDAFAEAIAAIPGRKVVVVLDCCHSGGIGALRDVVAPALRDGLSEGYYQRLAQGMGRVIYAAARDNEFSVQLGGDDYGLFTKHLLAGLQGGVASEDGMVRIFDLFEYVQPRVTAEYPQQHPVFKAEVEENFAIAMWRGGEKGVVSRDEEGYRYDAYVSYVDREPDATWVWETLVPTLEEAKLRVAVSGDVEEPGVARVVNVERGITQAKRTIVVLSDAYLADHLADLENVLAQTLGIQEGSYRLLPVAIEPDVNDKLPVRLGMLTTLNMVDQRRGERNFERLVTALQGPLPRRGEA
jgi:hypothetical protein